MFKLLSAHLRIVIAMLFMVVLFAAIQVGAASAASGITTAQPVFNDIYVNSNAYTMNAYNIDGFTYYKLRALAHSANILVWYDDESDTVYIDTTKPYNQPYTSDESDNFSADQNESESAIPADSKININGKLIEMESYLINNYIYFKLRDFTENTNIKIYYNKITKSIFLNSDNHKFYEQNYALLNSGSLWNEVTYSQANSLFYNQNSMVFVYYDSGEYDSRILIPTYRESVQNSNVKVFALDKNSSANLSGSEDFFVYNYSSENDIRFPIIYLVNNSTVEIFEDIRTPYDINNFFQNLSNSLPVSKENSGSSDSADPINNSASGPSLILTPMETDDTANAINTATPVPTVTPTPIPEAVPTLVPLSMLQPVNYEPLPSSTIQFINEVLFLINAVREREDLNPLILDERLTNAAMYKCVDIGKHREFSHTSKTYGESHLLMDIYRIPYASWGENIAAGQRTPVEVMTAFMESPKHRDNIMQSAYTHIGLGYLEDQYFGALWAQEFISKPRS